MEGFSRTLGSEIEVKAILAEERWCGLGSERGDRSERSAEIQVANGDQESRG